ncbi:hypothetical protein [Mycetohabitans sp. B46]|uniref:hypothetical protein n=1 Tax=Mycetohabitans sp. B46 TaxID=2772536 RepID=UPI00307FBB4B
MRKTIKLILMLSFSLVASSAWADIGDVDTEGYSMVIPNQTSTIRVQDIQVTNVVEEGAGCPENGRQARNANGAPLFCQSGVWKPAQSYQDTTMQVQDIQVTNIVEEGTKCPEKGRQARDANGAPLFCQSGV